MKRKVDPKTLGLHYSTQIYETESNRFLLKLDRKSRIVMKDGENILKKVKQIQRIRAGSQVEVVTSAPVCSKTKRFLSEEAIEIRTVSDWSELISP